MDHEHYTTHGDINGMNQLNVTQSIIQLFGFTVGILIYFNVFENPEKKKEWPHLARIKHWPGLVSNHELLMSYLHFVI